MHKIRHIATKNWVEHLNGGLQKGVRGERGLQITALGPRRYTSSHPVEKNMTRQITLETIPDLHRGSGYKKEIFQSVLSKGGRWGFQDGREDDALSLSEYWGELREGSIEFGALHLGKCWRKGGEGKGKNLEVGE